MVGIAWGKPATEGRGIRRRAGGRERAGLRTCPHRCGGQLRGSPV